MSSAYGQIQLNLSPIDHLLPLTEHLKDGSVVKITSVQSEHLPKLHNLLNQIIIQGQTYPFEQELDLDQFQQYFKPGFVLLKDDIVMGGFYIKPNFPGRCSHICNGGFIVQENHRGLGVGKALCRAFLKLAPAMGYKASMFNLVFENNIASVRLWSGMGFKVIGRVPKAGRLNGSDELVDAIQFYKDFQE